MRRTLRRGYGRLQSLREVVQKGGLADALFFDPEAYAAENEDVATAVASGALRSLYDHYILHGRWEGRSFAIRNWGLKKPTAARLYDAAHSLESNLELVRSALTYGELGHLLRGPDGGHPKRDRGACRVEAAVGPWRARLPRSISEGGYFTLKLRVAPVRAPIAITPLLRGGSVAGSAAALISKPTRTVQRLVWLPAGTHDVQLDLLDTRRRAQPVRFRLAPAPEHRLDRRMLRRLVHHHERYLGRPEATVREELEQESATEGMPLRSLLWARYEATFPPPFANSDYREWIAHVETPHFEAIDRDLDERLAAMSKHPLISIVMPTYNPDEAQLRACIASVEEQSYPHWELCIADDASTAPHVRAVLEERASEDRRIRLAFRRQNGHICLASNDALAMASGELVALLDHDDSLAPHALFHIAEAATQNSTAKLFYTDEDKLGSQGQREQPHFKPEFDPDLLYGQNYLGHLVVAKTDMVRHVGAFRPGYEGSQDHDLLLRLTHRLSPDEVVHVPWVLYHWRINDQSTASASSAKPYTAVAGLAAVRDALQEHGCTVDHAAVPNCYEVRRSLPHPPSRVSIIIPTRNAADLLRSCVASILSHTDYPDLELLLVDNGSDEPDALTALADLAADPRVRVIRDDRPFNFSRLNNTAAAQATGEVIALLNNDVEAIDPSWLRRLTAEAHRTEIGCVGPKLLYPDHTIQHAGVILGLHGVAGHPYKHMSAHHPGYFGRLTVTHSVSAVTAACLVVRRDVYDRIGGLDPDLAVAFNDTDFCMKLRKDGYRNLLVPTVELLHHESASRGTDATGSSRERFLREVHLMKERWGSSLYRDLSYSPHLSLHHDDYSLRLLS